MPKPYRKYKDGGYYMCRNCNTKRLQKYRQTPEGKEAIKSANKNYYEKNSEKHSNVWSKVKNIENEVCEVCGEVKVDKHHYDYNKPLDVVFLCRKHHKEVHRIMNNA